MGRFVQTRSLGLGVTGRYVGLGIAPIDGT